MISRYHTISSGIILAFGILLNATFSRAEGSWNITQLADTEVSGEYTSIQIVRDVAYCSNGWGLMVFDISNPDHPSVIEQIPTPGISDQICVEDTLLYLCDGAEGIRIYSIAERRHPLLVGTCGGFQQASRISVHDGFVYVNNYRGWLNVVDVNDPRAPHIVAEYRDLQEIWNISFKDHYAYFGLGGQWASDTLFICDVSDPMHLQVSNTVLLPDSGYAANPVVLDTLLFIGSPHFYIYNVSHPASPRFIGRTVNEEVPIYNTDMCVSGRRAYIVDYFRFYYIDLSNLQHPQLVSYREWGHSATGIRVVGNRGYLADRSNGLSVINITRPDNPQDAGNYSNWHLWSAVETNGDYVYVADNVLREQPREGGQQYTSLVTFSVSDPSQPRIVSTLDTLFMGEEALDFKIVNGNNLYATPQRGSTMDVISLADPANPRMLPWHDPDHFWPMYIHQQNDRLYMPRYYFGVCIYSIANPDSPRCVNNFKYIQAPYQYDYTQDLAIDGDYLYVSDGNLGIRTYKFDGPDSLTMLNITQLRYSPWVLSAYNGYLYCDGGNCTSILSLADPVNPREVNQIARANISYPYVIGDILYIIDDKGLGLYSLDDPERPELVGFVDTPGYLFDFTVWQNRIYVADYYDFGIYDASHAFGAWYFDLSAESHDFDTVAVDSSITWSFTITNRSRDARHLAGIISSSEQFTCPFVDAFDLASGADTTFNVTFTPVADSLYSGVLTIQGRDHDVELHLSGRGIAPSSVDKTAEPREYSLGNAYPNPFNSFATIRFSLKEDSKTKLTIYDLSGREVATLVNGALKAGSHTSVWNAEGVASGVYLVKMQAGPPDGGFSSVRKVTLVR